MLHKTEHIFFDLDHTIWDFETNSKDTLIELYDELKLENLGIASADLFVQNYLEVNDHYWDLYRQKLVSKATLRVGRFTSTFKKLGIPEQEMPSNLPDLYVSLCPHKSALMPNAIEVLDYLSQKYPLHIITNGFKESQLTKMESSGLTKYFDQLIFSEEVKCHKPDKEIFDKALENAKTQKETSVFIGDHLVADILGSQNAGLMPIFFNPNEKAHNEKLPFEIRDLNELKSLL